MATRRDAEYISAIETGLVLERMNARAGSYSVIAQQHPGITSIPMLSYYIIEGSPDAWRTPEKKPLRGPHGFDLPYAYQNSVLAHVFADENLRTNICATCTALFRKFFRGKILRCVVCGRLHPATRRDEPGFSEKIQKYFLRKKLIAYHDEIKYYLGVIPPAYRSILGSRGVNPNMRTFAVREPSGNFTRFFGNCTKVELLAIAAVILDRSLFEEYRFMYD